MTLSPAELAGIEVWLIGAAFTAGGMLTLAGSAGGWIAFGRPDQLYILGAMLIVVGTVIQDVVADAMSTEVVSRVDAGGKPRPEEDIRAELGMVQVLGRLALGIGILSVAGLSGWLAQFLARETVFLIIVPGHFDHVGGFLGEPRTVSISGKP